MGSNCCGKLEKDSDTLMLMSKITNADLTSFGTPLDESEMNTYLGPSIKKKLEEVGSFDYFFEIGEDPHLSLKYEGIPVHSRGLLKLKDDSIYKG